MTRSNSVRLLAVGLLISVILNILFFAYFGILRSDQRKVLIWKLSSLTHQSGPTVLLGDSIMSDLVVPMGRLVNLSVPGATVGWIEANQLSAVASLKPSRIILAAGINDLRYGSAPDATASMIISLGRKLAALNSEGQIIILSILPPAAVSELSGEASTERVREANRLILESAALSELAAIDTSMLLSARGALRDHFTYDGLHLNAAGRAVLEELLFVGLSGRGGRQ